MTTNLVKAIDVQCPYCWETTGIMVDCSVDEQSYIEDCQICCRPIEITVVVDAATDEPSVLAERDDN